MSQCKRPWPALFLWAVFAPAAAVVSHEVATLAEGLEHPWSMAWLPDGRMLVTERPGRLRWVDEDGLLAAPIEGVPPVFAESQGGLLDIQVDPEIRDNGWIYLTFAHGSAEANATRLVRARLDGMRLIDLEVLFTASPSKDSPVHYGGRIAFLNDGTLVLGLGDGFDDREQAQRLDNHFGKIIRIHRDGRIPADNPFVGTPDALPEIYSYGHRNVQGLVFDRETGRLWSHEHGPRGGDELNLIEPGGNYGWPIATHGIDYSGALVSPFRSRPAMIDPVYVWTPAIAPAGMVLYRGGRFPQWQGKLLISALVARQARILSLRDGRVVAEETMLEAAQERLRDIRVGPDGAVYVLTDAADGRILRLQPVEPIDVVRSAADPGP